MAFSTLLSEVYRLQGLDCTDKALQIVSREILGQPECNELWYMRALCLLKLEKYKGKLCLQPEVECCAACVSVAGWLDSLLLSPTPPGSGADTSLNVSSEAAYDAARALELGANFEADLVYGKALFFLGKFAEALKAFAQGKEKAGPGLRTFDQFDQWIDWSEERIKRIALREAKTIYKEMNGHGNEKAEKTEESKPPAANEMPAPKIKHDWYQTETHVVITILIRNQKAEDVKVNFTEKSVSVTAPLPSGSEYSLELDVCHPINPEMSSFKVVPSKIEVKMKKVDCIHWNALEGDGTEPAVKSALAAPTKTEGIPAYPSSASKKHDWNKLEADIKAEEENEKLEGDAALNQLFQKIYGQGSDETKRAMNKSFMESGGTVLSTNWKEVATDTVDVKPPDGMEYKKWN